MIYVAFPPDKVMALNQARSSSAVNNTGMELVLRHSGASRACLSTPAEHRVAEAVTRRAEKQPGRVKLEIKGCQG